MSSQYTASTPPSLRGGGGADPIRKRSNLSHAHHAHASPGIGSGSPFSPVARSSAALSMSSMGAYYSPSSGSGLYRSDEDMLVFDFGARYLRAGFGGEPHPRVTLGFGPETQRRTGDFRQFLPGYVPTPIREYGPEIKDDEGAISSKWGCLHELWRDDLRSVDLGLVESQLERALRSIDHTHLMLDLQPKKIIALFPSNLPRRLISIALSVLFEKFHQSSTITLVPQPFAVTLAAGVRTALVVDIGWETVRVVVIEEFRKVREESGVRAGKMIAQRMGEMVAREAVAAVPDEFEYLGVGQVPQVSLEDVEEVLARVGWCRPTPSSNQHPENKNENEETVIDICLPSITYTPIPIPFHRLSDPIEHTLFDEPDDWRTVDDHERPLHVLVYHLLRSVSLDSRKVTMGRIIVTGGIGNIPGVKGRLKYELERTVRERGWVTGPILGGGGGGGDRRDGGTVVSARTGTRPEDSLIDHSEDLLSLSSISLRDHLLSDEGGGDHGSAAGNSNSVADYQDSADFSFSNASEHDHDHDRKDDNTPEDTTTTTIPTTANTIPADTTPSSDQSESQSRSKPDPDPDFPSPPSPSESHNQTHISASSGTDDSAFASVSTTSTSSTAAAEAEAAAAAAGANPHTIAPPLTKSIRLIETSGSWAGASLFAPLHLRGTNEVERAAFEEGGLVYALSLHAVANKSAVVGGGSGGGTGKGHGNANNPSSNPGNDRNTHDGRKDGRDGGAPPDSNHHGQNNSTTAAALGGRKIMVGGAAGGGGGGGDSGGTVGLAAADKSAIFGAFGI